MRHIFLATILGFLLFHPPVSEGAVCLDGQSGCVVMSRSLPEYQSFTIELRIAWAGLPPPPSDHDNQAILFYDGSGGESQLLYQYEEGIPYLHFGPKMSDGSWHGIVPFSLAPWCDSTPHHIAAVHDANSRELRLSIDGDLVASASVPALTLWRPGLGTAIGRYGSISRKHCFGSFAEVRFWTRALTPIEIRARMWSPLSGTEEDLVGYWRLDEGSGATAVDRSPSGNNGTVLGGASWCEQTPPVPVHPATWGRIKQQFTN
jgi:hypothetical protein